MKGVEPRVSLIIPVRNGATTIGRLMKSVKQLDYLKDKLQVIVVDGHSTDGTREVVKKHGYEAIFEENKGANGARNTGTRHSNGEIIAFTDSDCVVPTEWLRKIVGHFSDSSVGGVGGNTSGARCDNIYALYADNSFIRVYPFSRQKVTLDKLRPFLFPPGCNMAFRREALEKIGFFNTRVVGGFEETELHERLLQAGYKIVYDPDIIVQHHHRSTLTALLVQAFRYGKGAASVALIPRRSRLAGWLKSTLTSFILYTALLTSGIVLYTYLGITIPLIVGILIPIIPIPFLTLFYAKRRKPLPRKAVIVFPFIDIARFLTFGLGEFAGLMAGRRA